MSAVLKLLEDLRGAGISVTSGAGGRLRIDSPAGKLTAALRDRIRAHKAALVALLDLEHGVRGMAARWGYSSLDLATALANARKDPHGWRALVDYDLERFGSSCASP